MQRVRIFHWYYFSILAISIETDYPVQLFLEEFVASSASIISTPSIHIERKSILPSFAGNDTHLLTVSFQHDSPCLPPFIIRGIDNVENIPIFETQSLTWQPTVLAFVIVKHGSGKKNDKDILLRVFDSTDFQFTVLIILLYSKNSLHI